MFVCSYIVVHYSLCIQDGTTALYMASKNEHVAVVKSLLKAKADLTLEDEVSIFLIHYVPQYNIAVLI